MHRAMRWPRRARHGGREGSRANARTRLLSVRSRRTPALSARGVRARRHSPSRTKRRKRRAQQRSFARDLGGVSSCARSVRAMRRQVFERLAPSTSMHASMQAMQANQARRHRARGSARHASHPLARHPATGSAMRRRSAAAWPRPSPSARRTTTAPERSTTARSTSSAGSRSHVDPSLRTTRARPSPRRRAIHSMESRVVPPMIKVTINSTIESTLRRMIRRMIRRPLRQTNRSATRRAIRKALSKQASSRHLPTDRSGENML